MPLTNRNGISCGRPPWVGSRVKQLDREGGVKSCVAGGEGYTLARVWWLVVKPPEIGGPRGSTQQPARGQVPPC
jgi:hypothetical protein